MPSFGNGSERRAAGRVRPAVLLAVLVSACVVCPGAAGQDSGAGSGALIVISSVSVRVDSGPAGADIENLITIEAGDPFSEKKLDTVLKQIYQTGLFSDIRVLREGETDIRLTFLLTRRLLTRDIKISGDKAVARKALREGLYALRPDAPFSDDRMLRAADELKEILRKQGYPEAAVMARMTRDPAQPAVDVTFEVEEGRRFEISSLEIIGGADVPQATLRRAMTSRPGRPYIPDAIESDRAKIKDLYGGLGFPRAEVLIERETFDDARGTVDVVFKVIPHERIRIDIIGADVPEELVRPIWQERVSEEWGLAQSEAKILSELRNRGYVFATAKSSIERREGEIRIVHEVNPGRKYSIYEVEFEGITRFTPAELKRELGLGLGLLTGIGGEKLFTMPRRVEELYATLGYSETRADLSFRRFGTEMRAICRVNEGPRDSIRHVSFAGASAFDDAALGAQIQSAPGGGFTAPQVQHDVGRLEAFYSDQGYRGTAITAAIEPAGERLHDVTFRVEEGHRVRIGRIIVTGNDVTRRRIIDRELAVREGDWAFADRILASKRNLERLGVFAGVRIDEIATGADAERLVISLREGQRNYVGIGAGIETATEPQSYEIWQNNLRPRGTAELILGNVLGRASQLSVVAQSSLKETRAVAAWEDRYFFGLPLQTSVNFWLERQERPSYGFEQRGASFTAVKPVGRDWVSFSTLRWASTTLTFLNVAENQVDRQHYPFSATSVSESFIRDRRDDAFNPEQGSFFSAVLEWAYPLFGVESDFLKGYLKYQRYAPVFGQMSFSLTARGGLGMGRMPIHERFFAGGANTFRGQPFDGLGPVDEVSGMPVGGKALFLLNLELRFPLFPTVPNLSGAAFYDGGGVFKERSDFSLGGFENAVGVGFRYRTPLGPLRIDLGWNIHPPENRKQPIIFITIGNVF
jgi:outer membrane protein insertion porin family